MSYTDGSYDPLHGEDRVAECSRTGVICLYVTRGHGMSTIWMRIGCSTYKDTEGLRAHFDAKGGMRTISKTAVVFRSQTLFGSVIPNFPSLQGHPKTWEGEVIFARDDNSIITLVGIRTPSDFF